jgi:hypothetical protein
MKMKNGYEEELDYQLDLMRNLDRSNGPEELALELIELVDLIHAGRLTEPEIKSRAKGLSDEISKVETTTREKRMLYKLHFIETMLINERPGGDQPIYGICVAHLPFIVPYLTVTASELEKMLRLAKAL